MENQNENTTQQETQQPNNEASTQPSPNVEGIKGLVDTITTMIELKFKELTTDFGDRVTHMGSDLMEKLSQPTKEEIEEEKASKRGGVF